MIRRARDFYVLLLIAVVVALVVWVVYAATSPNLEPPGATPTLSPRGSPGRPGLLLP